MKYVVVSKGTLRAGADRAEAIASLATLTRRTGAEVEARLLSGRESVLKRTDDHGLALELCERFKAAGLEVDLREQAEAAADPVAAVGDRAKPKPSRQGAWPRRLAVGALVLVLLVGGSVSALYVWLHREPPASVLQAEAALADGRLLALAHIDLERIALLDRFWFGERDPQAIPMPDQVQDLFAEFANGADAGQLDPRHMLFAVNAGVAEQGATKSLLLFGSFDAAALERVLATRFMIEKMPEGHWRLKSEQPADPGACEDQSGQAQSHYLYASGDSVLAADSLAGLKELRRRLRAGGAEQQDLGDWRAYRKGKLASAKLWSPESLGKAAGGMGGMLLNRAGSKNPEVSAAYLGLWAGLEEWALGLNARLVATDVAWLEKTHAEWNASLAELRDQAGDLSPALRKVAEALSVARGADTLSVELVLNDQVTRNFQDAVGEILAGMFSVRSVGGSPEPQAEQIDPSPWDYARNDVFRQLPAFDKENALFFRPEWDRGPAAVGVSSATLQDDLLQLEVKAGLQLPPDTSDGQAIETQLFVDAVVDADGNNLLRDERCLGHEAGIFHKNHEPATNVNVVNDRLLASKTVRLRPGTPLASVSRVKGRFEFAVPVEVAAHRIAARQGAKVEDQDLRFYLGKVGERSVSYRLSGDPDRIVEIRALNGQGQVLQRGGSMTTDAWFGPGRNGSIDFRGSVKELVVYVAKQTNARSFSFEVSDLFAPPAQQQVMRSVHHEPAVWNPESWESLAKIDVAEIKVAEQTWRDGKNEEEEPKVVIRQSPVVLTLDNDPASHWQVNPTVRAYLPLIPALVGNLSAYEFALERPQAIKDGQQTGYQEYWPVRPSITFYQDDRVTFRGDMEVAGQAYLKHESRLDLGLELGQAMLPVKGSLTLRVPRSLERHSVALPTFGEQVSVGGHSLRIVRIDNDVVPSMTVEITGGLDKLVTVSGLSADGKRLPAEYPRYSEGAWSINLKAKAPIKTLEVVTATEQSLVRVPFAAEADEPATLSQSE